MEQDEQDDSEARTKSADGGLAMPINSAMTPSASRQTPRTRSTTPVTIQSSGYRSSRRRRRISSKNHQQQEKCTDGREKRHAQRRDVRNHLDRPGRRGYGGTAPRTCRIQAAPTRTSTASAATAARAGATTATTIRTAARGATTARRRSSGQVRDDDGGASAEYSKPVTVKNVPRGELPRNADGERGQLLELRLHGRERSLERRHERRLPLRLLVHGRLARGCDLRLERNGLLCQLSFRRRADQADGADADHRHGRRLQRVHQRCYRRERRTDRDLLQQRGRLPSVCHICVW